MCFCGNVFNRVLKTPTPIGTLLAGVWLVRMTAAGGMHFYDALVVVEGDTTFASNAASIDGGKIVWYSPREHHLSLNIDIPWRA